MSHQIIAEINKSSLNSWNDALKLLKITKESPSISEINKAFRTIAILIHPDHNMDNEKAANEACKKLIAAKEYLLKGDKKADFAQSTSDSTNFDSDVMAMFSED